MNEARPNPARLFVDQIFDGNASKAADALGIPYSTMRTRYDGSNGGALPFECWAGALEIAADRRPAGAYTLRDLLPVTQAEWDTIKEISQ